jgi:hypothetical protein
VIGVLRSSVVQYSSVVLPVLSPADFRAQVGASWPPQLPAYLRLLVTRDLLRYSLESTSEFFRLPAPHPPLACSSFLFLVAWWADCIYVLYVRSDIVRYLLAVSGPGVRRQRTTVALYHVLPRVARRYSVLRVV